jgi:hypothetical protein
MPRRWRRSGSVRREASADPRSSIYVVLLEFAADDYELYVGLTGLTPDERYLISQVRRPRSSAPRARTRSS